MEKYININGVKICYEEHGQGEVIFLLHGVGAKKETWIAQINALANYFKVISFDMRGVGKSDRPNELYTMNMLADDLKRLMEALSIEKAHIIGRSLGGMIAQHFALKYPKKVQKLVLLTTNSRIPNKKAADLIEKGRIEEINNLKESPEKAFWQKAKLLFHKDFRKKMKENPEHKFFGIWSVKDLIAESIRDHSKPQDIKNLSNALTTHDILEKLNQISHDTLLISGSHDRLTPKSSMEEIHRRLPNSQLITIKKAGHFLHLSHAPEVNKIIIEFLPLEYEKAPSFI
jgi:proline-specific peptidase